MKWAVYVERMEVGGGAYRNVVGRQEGRNHLEDPDARGKIILKWNFRKLDRGELN